MTRSSRALVEVHVAALLYGFIGPFGKAVDLNPHQIVFWRTSLAALVLLAIARRLKSHTPVKNWTDLGCSGSNDPIHPFRLYAKS